ncbi:sigma-70 family RNA polymerase sigma factor [Piscinibacter sp. XHJ-5]|uniref:sigma-70 family RNA polymerase sigma factor n=1 Tax=Piscinibacter sp. XHJ-5 TaxID=3037797 RepID=UPI0024535082|nr:sigma-70 family RNA polymerase sigma factor [Piscinibacter sp. XHJ-5]
MNDSYTDHVFQPARRRLLDLARSVLGTQADAEDVVQDAWLRVQGGTPQELRSAEAWLATVVKHLAIDRLRRRRLDEESLARHVDPGHDSVAPSAEHVAGLALDSAAALRRLTRVLTPVEVAALLLREVFEMDYAEIARSARKGEAACRQIVHRALKRAKGAAERRTSDDETAEALFHACWRAVASGNPAPLHAVLGSPEVVAEARTLAPRAACAGAGRIRQGLAQVGGRLAVVVVMDGQVLCTLPLGLLAGEAQPPTTFSSSTGVI